MFGIIADAQLRIAPSIVQIFSGLLMIALTVIRIQKKKIKWWKYSFLSLLLILAIFIAGVLTNGLRSSLRRTVDTPSGELLLIQLTDEIKSTGNKRSFKALTYAWDGVHWSKKVRVYLYVTQQKKITKGSLILTLNHLKKIRKKSNPGEFDFARYAAINDVYHSLRINNDSDYILIQHDLKKQISSLEKAKDILIKIIRKHFHDKRESGLAEAILLGYRKDLDQDLIQDYLDTGVIHVIAISGMHLGLIFSLVNFLVTSFVGKNKSKWAAFLVSLPLLWCFAFLTGASASVLRGTIMFSFSITGALIQRKNQSINGLGGALLFLLLHDPDAWLDLGFQLSFAAVLSIMLFNKMISSYLYFRNPLLKNLWNLVAVTLSAQVLTTPLVIFHFHRFPMLFLFTNIIAVPLSSFLLLLEIMICIFDPFPVFSLTLGSMCAFCMKAMNAYIGTMAKIPFGMIDSIYISGLTMLVITLLILCAWQLFKNPSKSHWKFLIILILIFSIVSTKEKYEIRQIHEIFISNINRKTIYIHRHGANAIVYTTSRGPKDQLNLKRIKNYCKTIGIKSIVWKELPDQILMLEAQKDTLIAHASGDLGKSWEWRKAAQKLHLRFHSSSDEGPLTFRCSHSTQKR